MHQKRTQSGSEWVQTYRPAYDLFPSPGDPPPSQLILTPNFDSYTLLRRKTFLQLVTICWQKLIYMTESKGGIGFIHITSNSSHSRNRNT